MVEEEITRQEERRKRRTSSLIEEIATKKQRKCSSKISLDDLTNVNQCVSFTGFTPQAVRSFLAQYGSTFEPPSTFGAGRRSTQTAESRGLFILNYLRNGPSLMSQRRIFGLCPSTLEAILSDVIPRLLPEIGPRSLQIGLGGMSVPFEHFENCFAAVDTTFIPHPHPPNISFEQAKNYFSVKHGAYGYKWLAAVNSSGQLVFLSNKYPGGAHDLTICTDETVLPFIRQICGSTYLMADKGFIGLDAHINALIPIKQSSTRPLSLSDKEFNLNIAKTRILVENFFGRLKVVWSIFAGYSGIHANHLDDRFHLAAYLTNFHLLEKPLRKKTREIAVAEDDSIPDEFSETTEIQDDD